MYRGRFPQITPMLALFSVAAWGTGCLSLSTTSRLTATLPAPSPIPKQPLAPTAVSMVSAISQNGFTWSFSSPVLAGQYVNGDWFVVGPVSITEILPASVQIVSQGRYFPPGGAPPQPINRNRWIHGSMLNPDVIDKTLPGGGRVLHGYDQCLTELDATTECGYRWNSNLNVGRNVSTTSPLTIVPTSSLPIWSLVSTRSRITGYYNECDGVPANCAQLKGAAVLTIVRDVPVQGSFRPPYAGTQKGTAFDESMLDFSRLRSVATVGSAPNFDTVKDSISRVWLDHFTGWPSRYLHPVDNMPDYGRDFTSIFSGAMLMANTALPFQQKRDLVVRLVQLGIDMFANVREGARWESVGGQNSGRLFPILFAGVLLNDPSMKAVTTDYPTVMVVANTANSPNRAQFGELSSTFYVAETSPGSFNWNYGGYSSGDVGLPEWGNRHVHETLYDDRTWNVDAGMGAYRRCCTANAWVGQTLAARMMGMQGLVGHPAYFDYMDRYLAIEPPGDFRSWQAWQGQMWDAYRPQF